MYMIRNIWRAQRGQAPALVEALKVVNQAVTSQPGFSQGKIYADMSGTFDTVTWQFEAESLDRFFQVERGIFVNPDAATQKLIDTLNGGAVEGGREIYEVLL